MSWIIYSPASLATRPDRLNHLPSPRQWPSVC